MFLLCASLPEGGRGFTIGTSRGPLSRGPLEKVIQHRNEWMKQRQNMFIRRGPLIPVSVKKHSVYAIRCLATQQQKLLSSPWEIETSNGAGIGDSHFETLRFESMRIDLTTRRAYKLTNARARINTTRRTFTEVARLVPSGS